VYSLQSRFFYRAGFFLCSQAGIEQSFDIFGITEKSFYEIQKPTIIGRKKYW
jgi:hypothetical protein